MADSNPEVRADTLPKDALFLFCLRLLINSFDLVC